MEAYKLLNIKWKLIQKPLFLRKSGFLSSNEANNELNIDFIIIDNDLSYEPEYSEVIRKKYTGIINFWINPNKFV